MHMTSREFNQRLGEAQKAAQISPVFISNRGKPALVLMSQAQYEKITQNQPQTLAKWFEQANPDVADIDFELPPRSTAQRPEIDWGEIE